MPTVNDIYNYIDSFAPFNTQMSFDNAGLLCGNKEMEVTKIAVSLDVTMDVVNQAIKEGAQLIVSHHPIIFNSLKNIPYDTVLSKVIAANISVISAHTNLDAADGGVNDALCSTIGVSNTSYLYDEGVAIGRIGTIPSPMSASELSSTLMKKLNSKGTRYSDANKPITKTAVCCGGGGFLIEIAAQNGADVLITGEAKHHEHLKALELGVSLIECGHFSTEVVVIPKLVAKLSQQFPTTVVFQSNQTENLLYTL